MSLSKLLKTNLNVSEDRQSYSDRICDDLSEIILQYLPLKHKLRLECVSEQFQRTVFSGQNQLFITRLSGGQTYLEGEVVSKEVFESVLKKCSKVKSIIFINDMNESNEDIEDNEWVIELINKYCNNLTQIIGDPFGDNEWTSGRFRHYINCEKLIKKFDSKSVTLIDPKLEFMEMVLRSATRVKEVNFQYSKPNNPFVGIPSLSLRSSLMCAFNEKVKTISVGINSNDFNDLKTFFESIDTSKVREIRVNFDNGFDSSEKMNQIFNYVSKLKNLVQLTIFDINCDQSIPSNGFKQIAINCLHLKEVSFTTYCVTDLISVLKPLKALKRLKRLHLRYGNLHIELENDILFKHFQDFKDLTHLTFGLNVVSKFGEKLIKDIDIYLPKLRYLRLENCFLVNDWTIDTLSRLSRLETIRLGSALFGSESYDFMKRLNSKLIQNCKYIRNVDVLVMHRITRII